MSKDGLFDKPPSSNSFWNKNALSYGEEMKDDLQTRNVDETKRSHQMTCYNCNGNLIWGGDHDLEDDEEHTILTNLSCPSCRAQVLVYWGNKTEQEFDEDGMYK